MLGKWLNRAIPHTSQKSHSSAQPLAARPARRQSSKREDDARGRAVRQQRPGGIEDAALGGGGAAADMQRAALGADQAGLLGDRPHHVHLDLQGQPLFFKALISFDEL